MKTGTTAEHTVIGNYINGNLTDAKAGAQRLSWRNLMRVLQDDYGKTGKQAIAIADFLKGQGTFEAACEAERGEA